MNWEYPDYGDGGTAIQEKTVDEGIAVVLRNHLFEQTSEGRSKLKDVVGDIPRASQPRLRRVVDNSEWFKPKSLGDTDAQGAVLTEAGRESYERDEFTEGEQHQTTFSGPTGVSHGDD